MANTASQKKRISRTSRERTENRQFTSEIKTIFRRLEDAHNDGDGDKASVEHRELVSTIDKAVKIGALHKNTAARRKARAARILASG